MSPVFGVEDRYLLDVNQSAGYSIGDEVNGLHTSTTRLSTRQSRYFEIVKDKF